MKSSKHQDKTMRGLRPARVFSEGFQKMVVSRVEKGELGVTSASREYGVSAPTVYRWLDRHSRYLKHQSRIIVEKMSDSQKIKDLRSRIAELERLLGQKQLEIEYKSKLIELASEAYGEDIEKKSGMKRSAGSGRFRGKEGGGK